ncbi:SRPBCC family protein [Leptolyngbya sp. NIES-2104]|uniref:SRPBCC family protein n=1 Tax=Leptolyngbya sp. NIES-2104 TaxID=1552121 RepID=UPI00073E4FBB
MVLPKRYCCISDNSGADILSKVLNVPADKVWSIVRDFGALPKWFPFVIFQTCLDELERLLR